MRSLPQVLVIESDEADCSQLCQLMHAWGVITQSARTRNEAASLLERQTYQLILLTAKAAEIDSSALLREVRQSERNSATPVVGMTLESDVTGIRSILEAGANDILSSPTSVRAVARICWYWLNREQMSNA